jgi:hypothetical protein
MKTYEQILKEANKQGHPIGYEDDLICNICGEPWEKWGIRTHDCMTEDEAKKFFAGKGCPSCKGQERIE